MEMVLGSANVSKPPAPVSIRELQAGALVSASLFTSEPPTVPANQRDELMEIVSAISELQPHASESTSEPQKFPGNQRDELRDVVLGSAAGRKLPAPVSRSELQAWAFRSTSEPQNVLGNQRDELMEVVMGSAAVRKPPAPISARESQACALRSTAFSVREPQDPVKQQEKAESPVKQQKKDGVRTKQQKEDLEKLERKKRRRMIRHMRKPGATPSFVALVTPNVTEEAPKRIRIDVDEYLGLKKKRKTSPSNEDSRSALMVTASAATPSDEGWFEGAVPLTLPHDTRYLSELQVLIRANLELFSATEADINVSKAGRRSPTVRGKVGVRCRHCAKARGDNASFIWPAGSMSYPFSIAGLYPVCSQKPQLHFQNCPYMPPRIKALMHGLMFDEDGNSRTRQPRNAAAMPDGGTSTISISAVTYYVVAAKMIGLVDVPGGLRFGRDLTLDPLPMESVQAQIGPSKRTGESWQAKPAPGPSHEPRIMADVESERVLAQAVAEKDDQQLLGRSGDKELATDFIFLCIKQLAVCNAVRLDFETPGKKSKSLKPGFAGFCCRHCCRFNPKDDMIRTIDYSSRWFPSAAENFLAAITATFYGHTQKCPLISSSVRHALSAYKRLHSKQIARSQKGAQKRLFQVLWHRLRAADLSPEELEEKLRKLPLVIQSAASISPMSPAVAVERVMKSPSKATPEPITSTLLVSSSEWDSGQRGPMPLCNDIETLRVLKEAEENQDTSINGNLLRPSDRHLISDYVFLMMKQVKAAGPNTADFSLARRISVLNATQVGLQCLHCAGGLSLPAAADNLASVVNGTLYTHVQKCSCAPNDIKHALAKLKEIHPAQRSSFRFGSQRHFYKMVIERLKNIPVEDTALSVQGTTRESTASTAYSVGQISTDTVLQESGFIQTGYGCYECQFCRMVPYALRAPDAVAVGRPTNEYVREHQKHCKGDSFDLRYAASVLKSAVAPHSSLNGEQIMHSSLFTAVISKAVGGNEELTRVFTGGIEQAMINGQDDADENAKASAQEWRGLWSKFPSSIDTDALLTAFKVFAETVPGLDDDLFKAVPFLRFFQIVSPTITAPSAM